MDNSDIEKPVVFFELGENAEGSIEARDDQQERLEEFTQRIGSGEFHKPTEHKIPCGCIDGRCGCTMKPNSAGGTISLMVADGTTRGAYEVIVRTLNEKGEIVGGHDDEHAGDGKSGCGANDKLDLIYAMIVKQADYIRELTQAVGISVSDQVHDLIVNNASSRTDFSSGAELLDTLKSFGDDKVDHLRRGHNEVLVGYNKQEGTTLDRDAAEAEFGHNYEAFNVDAWAFENGARAISDNEEEVEAKVVAMAYYNIGTALVLGGKKLRAVVLE